MTVAEELRRALDRLTEGELSPEEARSILGPLHALLGAVVSRAVQPPAPPPIAPPGTEEAHSERVLTVRETAGLFGRSVWWVRGHRGELPGFVRLPGKRFGFRERAVTRWIERRSRNA